MAFLLHAQAICSQLAVARRAIDGAVKMMF
jgi:hypothetical protein